MERIKQYNPNLTHLHSYTGLYFESRFEPNTDTMVLGMYIGQTLLSDLFTL